MQVQKKGQCEGIHTITGTEGGEIQLY